MKYWYLNMDIKSGFDPGQENYLEKGMATQSSILEFHGQKGFADCSPWGHKMLNMTMRLSSTHE